MAADGERLAAVGPQALEHAIAHGQAVIERVNCRIGVVDEIPVEPDHRTAANSAEATDSNLRALSSVSAHSPAGSESQVMPPPVPRWTSPSSNQNVRMATLRSPN